MLIHRLFELDEVRIIVLFYVDNQQKSEKFDES